MMREDSREWCNFWQRFERTAIQIRLKHNKAVNWADENVSFVIVKKTARPLVDREGYSRLVARPKKRGGHVQLRSCDDDAEVRVRVVAKSHGKDWYTSARKSRLGDLFDMGSLPEKRKREADGSLRLTKMERFRIEGRHTKADKRRLRREKLEELVQEQYDSE
eukprot:TRINITY_DN9111_c0_g1_i1.p1 TRINITY_DN9111_c0_g1~~TRINITY_DN9111_c0_g1_i1.p1  ORF type:complete len:163 (-),score=59.73 TRINITY_DN9111_c0_g1_i1:135-623(-)